MTWRNRLRYGSNLVPPWMTRRSIGQMSTRRSRPVICRSRSNSTSSHDGTPLIAVIGSTCAALGEQLHLAVPVAHQGQVERRKGVRPQERRHLARRDAAEVAGQDAVGRGGQIGAAAEEEDAAAEQRRAGVAPRGTGPASSGRRGGWRPASRARPGCISSCRWWCRTTARSTGSAPGQVTSLRRGKAGCQ